MRPTGLRGRAADALPYLVVAALTLVAGCGLLGLGNASPTPGQEPIVYVVQPGDTYTDIVACLGQPAEVSRTTMAEELETLNGRLQAYTTIVIPRELTGGQLCEAISRG